MNLERKLKILKIMVYKVSYISSMDGDCCSVWVEASSVEEAKENVRNEHWDVEEVIGVTKMIK